MVIVCAAKASPPGIPSLDKVGKNYVDLSWTKPRSDGGSPVKGSSSSHVYTLRPIRASLFANIGSTRSVKNM